MNYNKVFAKSLAANFDSAGGLLAVVSVRDVCASLQMDADLVDEEIVCTSLKKDFGISVFSLDGSWLLVGEKALMCLPRLWPEMVSDGLRAAIYSHVKHTAKTKVETVVIDSHHTTLSRIKSTKKRLLNTLGRVRKATNK